MHGHYNSNYMVFHFDYGTEYNDRLTETQVKTNEKSINVCYAKTKEGITITPDDVMLDNLIEWQTGNLLQKFNTPFYTCDETSFSVEDNENIKWTEGRKSIRIQPKIWRTKTVNGLSITDYVIYGEEFSKLKSFIADNSYPKTIKFSMGVTVQYDINQKMAGNVYNQYGTVQVDNAAAFYRALFEEDNKFEKCWYGDLILNTYFASTNFGYSTKKFSSQTPDLSNSLYSSLNYFDNTLIVPEELIGRNIYVTHKIKSTEETLWGLQYGISADGKYTNNNTVDSRDSVWNWQETYNVPNNATDCVVRAIENNDGNYIKLESGSEVEYKGYEIYYISPDGYVIENTKYSNDATTVTIDQEDNSYGIVFLYDYVRSV